MTDYSTRGKDPKDYDYLTYEYRRSPGQLPIVVHGWGTYGKNSVLAGQAMKCFLDSFASEKEAKKAYPTAKSSHPLMQPQNTYDHLSDDDDSW